LTAPPCGRRIVQDGREGIAVGNPYVGRAWGYLSSVRLHAPMAAHRRARARGNAPVTDEMLAQDATGGEVDPSVDEACDEFLRVVDLINCIAHRAVEESWHAERLNRKAVRILFEVDRNPGMTLAQVAHALGLGKARASELVSDLEARGYLRKDGDARDRRLIRIVASEAVRRMRRRSEDAYLVFVDSVLAPLSQGERQGLLDALRGVSQLRGRALGMDVSDRRSNGDGARAE